MAESITDIFNKRFGGREVVDFDGNPTMKDMKDFAAQNGYSLRVIFEVETGAFFKNRLTVYTRPAGPGRYSVDTCMIG